MIRPPFRHGFLPVLAATVLVAGLLVFADPAKEPIGTPSDFPGMVRVEGAKYEMGVDEKYFEKQFLKDRRSVHPKLQGDHKEVWWPILLLETPAHSVETEAFAVDRYEVTNAQYHRFLEDACKQARITDLKMNSIYAVATAVYGENPTEWEMESIYLLNRTKLTSVWEAVKKLNASLIKQLVDAHNADLPPAAPKISEFDELPEAKKTRAWGTFVLPEGSALTVYTREMPQTWVPDGKPPEGWEALPVQWVSGLDADAFAAWAGKHVPTEAEWERAARGPENWLYPWGDEWDCDAHPNWIHWSGTKVPPAPPTKDRPVAVDSIPESQSPFGCYHMLGNVMEWTSSTPEKYPRSESKWPNWGGSGLRVLRGCSYGQGEAYLGKELSIRNTTRILDGYGGPVHEANRYEVLGFRCAKYGTPARDSMIHALERPRREGILPKEPALDAARAYGAERDDYVADAKHHVYVAGHTQFVGVVPAEQLDFATVSAIADASEDAAQGKGPPVILAFLMVSPELRIDVSRWIVPEKEFAPPPDGVDPGGDDDDGEEGGNGGGEGDEDGGGGPADAPAEEPAEPGDPEAEPAAPTEPYEELQQVNAPADGFLLGVLGGRIALFEIGITGPRLFGYLPDTAPASTVIEKAPGKDYPVSAVADPAAGKVKIRMAFLTRSRTSKDVFGIELGLRVHGMRPDGWRSTE